MHIVIFAPSTRRFEEVHNRIMNSFRKVVPSSGLINEHRGNLFFKDCEEGPEQIQLQFSGNEYIPDDIGKIRKEIAKQTGIPVEKIIDIYQCDMQTNGPD